MPENEIPPLHGGIIYSVKNDKCFSFGVELAVKGLKAGNKFLISILGWRNAGYRFKAPVETS